MTRDRLVIAGYLLLAALMLPGLFLLRQDNSPQAFFVADDQALTEFRELEAWFGPARGLRVVLQGPGLWSVESLAWLAEIEAGLEGMQEVMGVASVVRHHRWRLDAWPPPDPAAFRALVLSDPLDRDMGWVSADGEVLTLLVGLYRLEPAPQSGLLARIEALLARPPPGIETSLAGLPAVNRALDREMLQMALVFFPLLGLLAVLLLTLCYRGPREVALPMLFVIACQVPVFGAMGYLGVRINLVLIVLVPLLFVIALATAVHLLGYQRRLRRRGLGVVAASRDTYRVKGWAVFWTGVTTCVGFGSLVISEVPPVRMLGAWAAVGIAFMTLAALHLCPALLRQARDAPSTGWFWEGHAELWGRAWGGWAVRHRGRVIAAFTLFGLLWLLGLGGLEVRTNVLDYLPAQDPVRAELLALEARDIGVLTADLVLIRNSAEAGFDDPATLERLAELTQALRQEPLLLGVVGLPELADGVARYAETAAVNPRAAALAEVRGRPELAPVLGYFLTPKRARTRIVLWIPMRGFGELEPLFERARAQAQAAFPEAEVQLGGQYPLVLAAQRSLLRTMIGSLGLTLASVALLFVLLLRDRRQAGFALLANLWPVGFVLGAMGWLGVGLDSATVMIAAVVLGLAVDDSLHYLGSYRRLVLEQARGKAAVTGLEHTAGGHLLSSVILAAGFGVCGLSSLVPVAQFGALSGLAILAALVVDLLLVPALFAGGVVKRGSGLDPSDQKNTY